MKILRAQKQLICYLFVPQFDYAHCKRWTDKGRYRDCWKLWRKSTAGTFANGTKVDPVFEETVEKRGDTSIRGSDL